MKNPPMDTHLGLKNMQDLPFQEDEERGQQKPQQTEDPHAGCDLLFEDDYIHELIDEIKEYKFYTEPYAQQGKNDVSCQ